MVADAVGDIGSEKQGLSNQRRRKVRKGEKRIESQECMGHLTDVT